MWIIEYLPEFAIHAIFAVGVIGLILGFLLSFIPFVRSYKLAIQIISILVFTLGVYLEGGLADAKIWRQKVLELEVKLKDAELKSAQVNTEIGEKVVVQTKVVKEKADAIIKYVDREVVKKEEVIRYVEQCSIPKDVVDAHNKAIDELNAAGKK